MASLHCAFFDIGDTLVTEREWVEGAKTALERLKSAGVRLGVISNTGDLTREQLKELLPDDFRFGDFEQELILLSQEVGIEKPDLRIFQQAVLRTGESPWRSLFVGENLTETIAAQASGMLAARIARVPEDLDMLVTFSA